MQFSITQIMGMQAWQADQGNYSFIILKDNIGFVCSYKNFSVPERSVIIFKDKSEYTGDRAPVFYYFDSLKEAQEACKKKYKELLLR